MMTQNQIWQKSKLVISLFLILAMISVSAKRSLAIPLKPKFYQMVVNAINDLSTNQETTTTQKIADATNAYPSGEQTYQNQPIYQQYPPQPTYQNQPKVTISDQEVTIPSSSAITISFPTPVTFDAGQKKSLPTAALLAHPILDSRGNVVAPVSTPVSIELQPVKGGAKIIAQSVVIGGRVIPILASSPLIPGKTITAASGAQQAQENQSVYSNLVGSVFGVFNSANGASSDRVINLTNLGNSVGTGIGLISGLISPKTTRQVEIPSGSMFVLTLQAPVTVLQSVVMTAPPSQTPAPTPPTAVAPTAPTAAPTPQTAVPTTSPDQSPGTP